CVLRERLPEVLDLLRSRGALELPLTVATPVGLDLGRRERGDGELVLLGCRRAAFEWALWRVARSQPNVEIEERVFVEGLLADDGPDGARRVAGVRFRRLPVQPDPDRARGIPWFAAGRDPALRERGPERARVETLRADLVVDASGRRSPAREWLRAIGAPAPRERSVPTGIFYYTRFYRLLGVRPQGASTGLIAGDLGWIKVATFPGDANTFSITVGTNADDRPMRALSEPAAFEAVIAAFPDIARWRARGVSRPIDGPRTPVLVMGGLANRQRSFVRDGRPVATGFIAIGDAAYHTNPIYGRGATCAILAAAALDDALRAHPGDLAAGALDYEERARREIEPFWEAAAAADRANHERAAASAFPLDPGRLLEIARSPRRALAALLGRFIGIYFEYGIVPATRVDATVYRAVMRVLNMLDDPRTSLLAPGVLVRVLPVLATALTVARPARFAGPTREEALAILDRVRSGRRGSGRRRSGVSAPRRLAPDSDVAGHA